MFFFLYYLPGSVRTCFFIISYGCGYEFMNVFVILKHIRCAQHLCSRCEFINYYHLIRDTSTELTMDLTFIIEIQNSEWYSWHVESSNPLNNDKLDEFPSECWKFFFFIVLYIFVCNACLWIIIFSRNNSLETFYWLQSSTFDDEDSKLQIYFTKNWSAHRKIYGLIWTLCKMRWSIRAHICHWNEFLQLNCIKWCSIVYFMGVVLFKIK